jgi:hypothetical protein
MSVIEIFRQLARQFPTEIWVAGAQKTKASRLK